MRSIEAVPAQKKAYVKPQLVTHGSVQQLTEGGHKDTGKDSGSNIKFYPTPIGGKLSGGW